MGVAVRTEAVLLQQVPISSLALSLQEHPPRVRMDVAVRTEAVLLQQVPISSLGLSPVGAPAPGANGCSGSHRGGAPTADPDLLVRPVPSRSTRPGCEWMWRFA